MIDFLDIKAHSPASRCLKNKVDQYYFLKGNREQPFEFWHYPHVKSSLVIFQDATVEVKDGANHIYPSSAKGYACLLNRNFGAAKKEVIVGGVNAIGIVFSPLGINYFQPFMGQENKHQFKLYLDEVFDTETLVGKVELLDRFFEEARLDFCAPILKRVIAMVADKRGNVNLSELETSLGVSRRQILRYFKLHLGCSFRDYKNVLKFRLALEQGVQGEGKLSDVAYAAGYFDQSDFIKAFKAKTNETPKQLLQGITPINDQLLWLLD